MKGIMAVPISLLLAAIVAGGEAAAPETTLYAHCDLAHPHSDMPNLSGTVDFRQQAGSDQLEIKVRLTGLDSADDVMLHGFHVHQYGKDTEGCGSMGGHWNPDGVDHGAPTNPRDQRHPGDFGSLKEDGNGGIVQDFTDPMASLIGKYNIAGHGLVLHAGADDLGRGGNDGSRANGNAGPRYGCCVIKVWDDSQWN